MSPDDPRPPRRGPRRATRPADGPAVPQWGDQTSDDTDAGWGEPASVSDDEQYLRDRPPHWGNG